MQFFLLTGGTAGSEYLVACGLVKKSLSFQHSSSPFVETFKKTEVQGNRLQSIDITGYWVFIIAKRSTLNHFFDQHYKLLCSVYLLHSSII